MFIRSRLVFFDGRDFASVGCRGWIPGDFLQLVRDSCFLDIPSRGSRRLSVLKHEKPVNYENLYLRYAVEVRK